MWYVRARLGSAPEPKLADADRTCISDVQDCLSLLEKRVRSRCQSHILQMIPPSSFTAFCELGKRLLLVEDQQVAEQDWASAWNAEVEVSFFGFTSRAGRDCSPAHPFLQRFFAEKRVVEYLRRMWSINGNVPTEIRSTLVSLAEFARS